MRACLRCKTYHDDDVKICPDCGEDTLSAKVPDQMVLDTMKIEIESRSEWIRKMNEILGYDNSDGLHSEPCPHDLARELRKFVHAVAKADNSHDQFYHRAVELISKLRTPCPI